MGGGMAKGYGEWHGGGSGGGGMTADCTCLVPLLGVGMRPGASEQEQHPLRQVQSVALLLWMALQWGWGGVGRRSRWWGGGGCGEMVQVGKNKVLWDRVELRGIQWGGMVWGGVGWYDTVRCGTVWYGMVCHDMPWHDVRRSGAVLLSFTLIEVYEAKQSLMHASELGTCTRVNGMHASELGTCV